MIGKKLNSDRVVTVDCDDSLILWNISDYPDLPHILVNGPRGQVTLALHTKNINLVKKLYKLGYEIVIWSASGADWAETIGRAVGLDEAASLYMSKPRYYVDDLPSTAFMGERIWRDPVTGKSDE